MTQVRSTLLGTKEQLPGRPQENRGGSPEGVFAQSLFNAGEKAREEALREIQADLLAIKESTPALKKAPQETNTEQPAIYSSAYVPEALSPEAEPERVVEKPNDSKILGIFPRPKTPAEIFKKRQEALQKAA